MFIHDLTLLFACLPFITAMEQLIKQTSTPSELCVIRLHHTKLAYIFNKYITTTNTLLYNFVHFSYLLYSTPFTDDKT